MPRAAHASALALGLAYAENALHALTDGQLDSVVDLDGGIYLLRAAQERLRQDEARLSTLLENVPDVITVLGADGIVEYQSPAVTRVLGYPDGALVGTSFLDSIHPDDRERCAGALAAAIENVRRATTLEFRHRAHDGSWRPLEATLGTMPAGGTTVGILTFRDTSHRLRAQREATDREAAATQSSLDKDRFLAVLSHELRAPLTPVLFGVHALLEDPRFDSAKPTLEMIRRNIELQARLLDELMDFTVAGRHKVRLNLEPINVHDAVQMVVEICQSEIDAAGIVMRIELQADACVVVADSARLQQVMWNVTKNAIKFSERGGKVSIVTSSDAAGTLTVDFTDHGIGIEAVQLPTIFDAFQQGDAAMQHQYGGLGLGLFVARELAAAQGATLTAASRGRGKGAVFSLSIPRASVPDAS